MFAQNDSCDLQVSILTCTPGDELYSTFGHSALRIVDNVSHTDYVYNYGTFNFDEPDFYTKFVRGKLSFYLSVDDYDSFMQEYREEDRGVEEQVLNLTCTEKQNILILINLNLLPGNRFYKYDWTFDNCTTRLRDLVEKAADTSIHFGTILHTKETFRDLIYVYLDRNDKQWSKFGIDILLGSPTDEVIDNREVMFLPDYLMAAFDSTTIDSRPLVEKKNELVHQVRSAPSGGWYSHPLFIFSALFILIVLLSFSTNNFIKRLLVAFDGFLFFITGVLGFLPLFMWFGTDHQMCRDNFNLLWAWPTNAIAAFYMHSKKKPATKYFMLYAVFNLVLFACWFFLPQHLNPSLIPIIAILVFRSFRYISAKKI